MEYNAWKGPLKMISANYHTHTIRCKHAVGTEREYIEAAISEGFKILGFSDHTPQPYPESFTSGIRMDMSELQDYTDTLVKLRDEYKDDIQILIGYEVEYSRKYFEPLLKELKKYPLDYIILLISVPCISIFFSVHYLTIYYLLQPFNAGTEMKSGMYTFITSATYFACYMLMQCRFPTHIFGLITIIFSLLYCVIACLLVYRFAPKSFRIRN